MRRSQESIVAMEVVEQASDEVNFPSSFGVTTSGQMLVTPFFLAVALTIGHT